MTSTAVESGARKSGAQENGLEENELPRRGGKRQWRSFALAAAAYLLLSILVWWQIWSGHPTSTTTCGCGDSSLFTWFLAWPPYAISHGLNPLFSTAMLHPTGVNLLANTAELGLGVVLAPVTWLFGPIASLNVALTLGPALSALAMFVLLRRWVTWIPAAFIGGLLYGFSPFVLVELSDAHLMLGWGFTFPLIVLCIDEIFVRQRSRPAWIGIALGVLVAVQYLLGTELLTICVIACGIGIALVVVYRLGKRDISEIQVRYISRALLVACGAVVVFLAYPVWFTLAGPAHFHGSVWPADIIGRGGTTFKNYLLPPPSFTAEVKLVQQIGGYQGPALANQYFGIGLIVVLLGGLLVWRRDRRLWLFAIIAMISVLFSLGLENNYWVPWRILVRLPLVQNIIPVRFVAVTYFAAAVMLAIIVDHTRGAGNKWFAGKLPGSSSSDRTSRLRCGGAVCGVAVALIALVPIADYLAQTVPMTTQRVALPTWFKNVAPHLTGHPVLLVFPVPLTVDTASPVQSAMTWQAVSGMHFSMIGGGGPAARLTPAGPELEGQRIVAALANPTEAAAITPSQIGTLRRALHAWGVTMVVIPDQTGVPPYNQVAPVTTIAAVMSAAVDERPIHQDSAWVWSNVKSAPPAKIPQRGRLTTCVSGVGARGLVAVDAATKCMLGAG